MSDTALAEVRSWSDLHDALRRRAESLDVSRATLDDVSGLCGGYSAKLLAPVPIRRLGRISLDALLGALGVKLILLEDRDAMEKVKRRLVKRARHR